MNCILTATIIVLIIGAVQMLLNVVDAETWFEKVMFVALSALYSSAAAVVMWKVLSS